jgi:tRNA A-37 threonylcarbamoyl transferase component Bud32
VVRHYHRGGAVMSVLADRYLRIGQPRVLRELQVNVDARARGIPTPEFKAGAWYGHGIFRRCDIATAYIPHARDLAAILFENAGAQNHGVAQAAQLLRLVIERGLVHRDLNLKNILVAPSGGYVIDLDRCAVVERLSPTAARAMRDRFFRSLAKWETKTGIAVAAGIKQTFAEAFRV